MNDSALDILAGTFKKQETLTDTNTYTFESKITVLDKNIGAGCPVHVFEKATGNLVYTTETDSESFIYVPNLLKNIKYFVVATDKNDTYNSIIFDLNWDFAQQSGSKYNLKYYSKYQAKSSKDIYTYTDTVSDLVYDPNLLYSISVPLQKEDQKATWFGTGIFNVENIDGFPSFSFKGSSSTYTYINFTPVQTGESFTIECYIRPLALFSGKTVAGSIFSQGTSQGFFISDDFRLSYKNKNLTINTISVLEKDTWYHVSVSYDSQRIRLFLNGKKEAEIEDSVGLEYLSSVFCVGAGFYGYLSGFKIFQESKYDDDFTPSFRPFGHLPVIYSNEEDPYASNTVLKSYISDSGYLKDKAKNIPLSFDYTIPKDSYIISNNSFIRTPTQYTDLALNGDFTIELKFRLLYRAGTNPVICGNKTNKADWTTNNWHIHADHPNQVEKYGLAIYGGTYSNFLANYPTIYNEPVSLVVQRKGTIYSYYFNGFADRSFTYATAMDTRTASYFSIGGDTSFELYDIKVTKGVARYSENYKDEQLQGSEALLKAYYQIVNYPFKETLFDARNALAFVNTGVLLTSDRSSYNTKSALFANSYFVTSKSYWYTPNESFTVEFKISCNILPLTADDVINTATLFSIFTATSDNFKLAIRDKYLSFYNGTEWLDSEFELDDEDTFKHIVLQRNSTSIKILAEGSLVLETTCPDLAGRRNVSIGANKTGSDTFNGYMNNLFIYKNYCKYEDNYEVPQDPDEYVPTDEEKEPDVIITPYTTSALNFEKGLIDGISSTAWTVEGSASLQTTNKIFGTLSLETKALGDSLSTTSKLITGGTTPFTIEFYALIKGSESSNGNYVSILSTVTAPNAIIIGRHKVNGSLVFYRYTNVIDKTSNKKIFFNEINKFLISYDGAALRIFINNEFDMVVGINDITWYDKTWFLRDIVDNRNHYGLIDNINIHDGIATKVRDPDPYEEFLVVDLAFDGENNSTKIVDNGTLKSNWTVNSNTKISTDQKFDGFSSLYIPYSNNDNDRNVISLSNIIFESGEDFTFSFEFIRLPSNVTFGTIFTTGVSSVPDSGSVWSINAFSSYYNNSSFSGLKDKVSFINEKKFNKIEDGLVSNTTIQDNVKYKVDIVRNGITTFLYINNVLDLATDSFQNDRIDFSNLCIGTPMWSNGMDAGISCYLKNVKIYKGVAVIPEDPTGKIQLDFDNNVVDKYGNSTWTNNGVTFNQADAVKGSAAYFNNSTIVTSNTNSLNFINKNFVLEYDFKNKVFDNVNNRYLLGNGVPLAHGAFWRLFGTVTNKYGSINLNYNNVNYGLTNTVEIENVYYNEKLLRRNGVLFGFKNDVPVSALNVTETFIVDFKNMSIGTANTLTSSVSFFNGLLDNFKATKDYEELFDINRPAVHLPLETNAIDTGFTPLTINSVGNPTYTTIDGKKCIKFESGKYLTINNNNIFNLGARSDFYIELDFYPLPGSSAFVLLSSGSSSADSNLFTITCAELFNSLPNTVYTYLGGTAYKFGGSYNYNSWNNIKIFRKGNNTTYILNGISIEYENLTFNYASQTNATYIGNTAYSSTLSYNGYMSNFKIFVGASEIPETYNDKKVLDLDFKPTGRSYLFKDNNNKCIIHPVNIIQRDYQDSEYCCSFNGTNQYLQLGENDLLNFGLDDFVINIKFKINNFNNNWQSLISCGKNDSVDSNKTAISIHNNSIWVLTKNSFFNVKDLVLNSNTYYNLVVYRENTNYHLILNDTDYVLEPNAISDNRIELADYNYNNNTIIGANLWDGDIGYFNGTIYSVKVLRNTSDLSLLVDKVKRPPVDTVPPDYRGLWVNSLAVWSSVAQESPTHFMNFDPLGGNAIAQDVLFKNTKNFLVDNFKSSSTGPVLAETSKEFLIDVNPLDKVYKLTALAGTWNATYLKADFEFLDSNDNIIMVMRLESDNTFSHSIWCGTSWLNLFKKVTNVTYTNLLVTLDSNLGLIAKTLNTGSAYAPDFSFTTSGFESITKLKVKNLKAYMDYNGGNGHSAYVLLSMLKDLLINPNIKPLVDVGYPVFTVCDLGTQGLVWTRNSLSETSNAKGFKGTLSNISTTAVSMFYTKAFTIDFTVAGYGNIFKKWNTNLRYFLNLSNTGVLTFTFYTSSSGQKTFTFNLGAAVINSTRLTLTRKEDGTLCLWVDGVLQTTSHSILSSYTYYADVNEPMDIGDSTLELYSLKVFDSSIGYIENLN